MGLVFFFLFPLLSATGYATIKKTAAELKEILDMKTRKDCFFGLHFDFHAMPGDVVGSVIDTASIEEMLDATKPDMIQVDTKGHAGISSYMTKAGVHAEVMEMDVLRVWRDLTKKRGIRLYAHHSGLYEEMQARLHPDWVSRKADGEPNGPYMSVFSPYADEVLIPQLREIAGEYGVDGAWVDGDEWATYVDYSDYAKNAYRAETGKEAPLPGEDGYLAYTDFCREGFRRYVAHYLAVLKAEFPDFEITSNWMYTHAMPEKRTVPIDFISGDYLSTNAVNCARSAARCIVNQHLTWDLMAWGQNAYPCSWVTRNRCTKEVAQLCQEAAVVLSLGGGFQFFNILYGTGGLVQRWAIPGWGEVADFCRRRRAFCFGAESMADIAVLYPAYYRDRPLFTGGAFNNVCGFISMLSDAGFSCDVLNESDLSALSRYRVVLLPAADRYDDATVKALCAYAEAGGTLIADGGVPLPEEATGVSFAEPTRRLVFPDGGGRLSCIETDHYAPTLTTAEPLIDCYPENYYLEAEREIGVTLNRYGKGRIACLTFALAPVYENNVTFSLKEFVRRLLAGVGYRALVSVTGSDYADLTLMTKDGHLMANVINRTGEHNATGVRTFREIPVIGPLSVHVRTDRRPKRVTLQPEGIPLTETVTEDGYIYTIDRLEIHAIVDIEL